MLSRRNVRIKVMQLLYMKNRSEGLDFDRLIRRYRTSINHSYELYLFSLLQFSKVLEYANRDAAKRRAKHVPTEEDKLFTEKLANNELSSSLIKNEQFQAKVKSHKLTARIQGDNTRMLYTEFSKAEEYKTYLRQESTFQDHQQILLSLFKFCVNSELYNDLLEDFSATWIDDKSLVVGTIKKTIRALPAQESFLDAFQPSSETTSFGEELLRYVYYDNKDLLEVIEPVLKNWDADRVAIIDMILLKMALSELLHFPTIPTKVTLNEFVEISKLYSTDKSKDFINGILDRLMKQLNKDGKINKEG
ncbi:MAG: transcription antitermination factor NusB, partial [Bacteroidota bacterium]